MQGPYGNVNHAKWFSHAFKLNANASVLHNLKNKTKTLTVFRLKMFSLPYTLNNKDVHVHQKEL